MTHDPFDRRTFIAGAAALAASGMLPRMSRAIDVPPANYDEAKIPDYTLPDPLVMSDGTKVTTADMWRDTRRPELLRLFADHVYGRTPDKQVPIEAELLESSDEALGGKAKRRQVRLHLGEGAKERGGPHIDVLLYTPADADGPVPTFATLNFRGNHSIQDDPAIVLPTSWVPNNGKLGITNNRANDASRGDRSGRWPVEMILARGYGLATIYYGDIDPDHHDGFKNGVHPLFDDFPGERPDHAWGSIGAWAWGLSRVLDQLEKMPEVDAKKVIAFGHSRLGKTSLWAGAQDKRFAITISNNSGCGGAALNRRAIGETVARIVTSFPHWFCDKYDAYANNENALPIDTHELIALCAPRPVYIASAEEDRWADPKGEFLAALHAGPVYELLGKPGVGVDAMPPVNTPAHGTVGYHIRTGKHDVTEYDWTQYMDFADKHLRG